MPSKHNLLAVNDLVKHYSVHGKTLRALDHINLDIAQGEVVGLVGESGSGKSTLGKLIAGLESKTEGSISFNGQVLPSRYRRRDFLAMSRDIQMIFQDPYGSLNPRMTVSELLTEPLLLSGEWSRQAAEQRAAEWLQRVSLLPEHMNRYAHEFSGGQRQRIGIARALINEPTLLICDEPISALDVSVQAQVVNLLKDLHQNMQLSMLFIAHDLSMVRYISERVVVMYLGRIVETGHVDQVFHSPAHPYTKMLIDANPLADPRLERSRKIDVVNADMPSPLASYQGCSYASRCPFVSEQCRQQRPELRASSHQHSSNNSSSHHTDGSINHQVACFHALSA